jgi:hypothetical protein
MGADRLPQLLDQAGRDHDRVRPTGVVAVRASPDCVESSTFVPACRPAFGGPMPDTDVTSSVQAPTQHRSQQNPQDANLLGAYRPNLRSLQRPLIVLAVGTFAIGTDAFVIGGVLPAVARSLDVSTGSAGLLVTAFAIAYAIGGPILAVATARRPPRALMVSALVLFVAANILAAVAPGGSSPPLARPHSCPPRPPSPVPSRRPSIAAGPSAPSSQG